MKVLLRLELGGEHPPQYLELECAETQTLHWLRMQVWYYSMDPQFKPSEQAIRLHKPAASPGGAGGAGAWEGDMTLLTKATATLAELGVGDGSLLVASQISDLLDLTSSGPRALGVCLHSRAGAAGGGEAGSSSSSSSRLTDLEPLEKLIESAQRSGVFRYVLVAVHSDGGPSCAQLLKDVRRACEHASEEPPVEDYENHG